MERVLYQLPVGWEWHKLKGLTTKIGSGATPKGGDKAYKPSGISLIRSLNVRDCFFKKDKLAFIDDEQADALKNVMVESGDVLLNITGASIARCCIVPDEFLPARVNQHVTIIRPTEKVDSKFLNYLIVNPKFKAQLLWQGAGGATRQALTKVMVEELDIPLPSLPEQKRIVEKLDALFIRIDTAIEHLQESVTLADALYASALNELATGVDGNKIKLGMLGKIIRGSSPRPKGDPRYYGGKVPRLMVADVTRDGRYVTPALDFLTDEGALKSRPVPKGTLTIQVSGNPGMPAILAVDACIHDGFAALIEIKQESISTEYLYFFLLAVAEQNNQMAVGAIFRNLTTSQLREIEITIPSYEKQLAMVEQMDMAEQKVKALKAELKLQLESICQLKASILDSAFKGEL